MKYRNLVVLFLAIIALSCEPTLTAEEVVQTAIEMAHGGKTAWETPKKLVYEKTTTLYNESGTVESKKTQVFHNILQPEFSSKVRWMEDSVEKRIVFDGKETFVFENGYQITDDDVVAQAKKDVMAAQFVLWQPYKLLTDEVKLTNEGVVRLEDGTGAYKIKATYPDSDTIWWFYFDAKTFALKENLIKHGVLFSHIKNVQQETATGLRLHKERKSFAVDSLRHRKYLRAHYLYTILALD